jgi:hypothetical protein
LQISWSDKLRGGRPLLLFVLVVIIVVLIIAVPITIAHPRPASLPAENLTPAELESMYESENAFNITSQSNVTIQASPGHLYAGNFTVQVYKPCQIQIVYSPTRLVAGSNMTSVPPGTIVSVSAFGYMAGPVQLPSLVVLNATAGNTLQLSYSVSVPQSASSSSYSFQLILMPKSSGYLARFMDVNLNVT